MIKEKAKRRRVFYVPGMISLVLIPIFCLYHFYKIEAFKVYSALEFTISNQEDFQKYKIEDLRKYRVFDFNKKKSNGLQELKELRFFVRGLVKEYDISNGAKICFGAKTDYDVFISVLNIIEEENVPIWGLFSNDIYAMGNPKPKSSDRRFVCGTSKYSEQNTIRMREEERKERLQVFQVQFLKQQWVLFVAYFGLVLLNIFALFKLKKG
ncbi:hypothetical protein ACFFLS_03180 [Flavobacterium procerum]|uniref:Uncharacterized protein n=1 Tax=Flavobacterium procerum TaxID=1455569 RepID=A0ABV6BKR1_9FLAO